MANVTYLEESFGDLFFWQNVIDFNAALIPVPLGAVSGSHSGFAFENADGSSFTLFLGPDIALGQSGPIAGTVTEIVRRTSLDPFGFNHVVITGSLAATAVYDAFRGGGDAWLGHFTGGALERSLSNA